MNKEDFVLNEIFEQNAKIYQTKPVRAMKYKSGMENGWMIYMSNKTSDNMDYPTYAGVKFFDTEDDAMRYIEADEPQYIMLNGELVECEVEYNLLRPVIYHKLENTEQRKGIDFGIKGHTFVSDESEMYDYFILENYSWIIQEADGSIRVWDADCLDCGDTFFGSPDEFVYEKCVVSGKEEYIKVAV